MKFLCALDITGRGVFRGGGGGGRRGALVPPYTYLAPPLGLIAQHAN